MNVHKSFIVITFYRNPYFSCSISATRIISIITDLGLHDYGAEFTGATKSAIQFVYDHRYKSTHERRRRAAPRRSRLAAASPTPRRRTALLSHLQYSLLLFAPKCSDCYHDSAHSVIVNITNEIMLTYLLQRSGYSL